MKRIIINADDCGMSCAVDEAIEKCIVKGEITSTTIMANMSDFEGAIRLYSRYNNLISFGIHLNLTEGKPLTDSKGLIDCGIAEKTANGEVLFCGNKKRKHYFNRKQREIIYNELEAQICKLKKAGIDISHIDGHHHIHTDFWILIVVIKLAKKYNIRKIRVIRNYGIYSFPYILRQSWRLILRFMYPNSCLTDWFTSYTAFVEAKDKRFSENQVLELMTHPGGYEDNEKSLLSNKDLICGYCKITYKEM